ncbi:MAG: efflux transporter outer membrane subunit [Lutibacter sp.]|uniref:efflux transporter outer membrane subunit n=1 Tax=Lutibacter sp. TaxID=1925666 RepID=UPI00299EB848|nr:efflux transporter outer membrane subunit [Lutibacter sp.]MDX1828601.1 efflux transporter outer membrane subunit [Lutibacter sp.]
MKKQHISKLIIVLIASVLLQSCFVAKNYKTPKVNTDNLFRTEKQLDSTSIAAVSWDKLFTDTILQDYIKEGLANNYDVKIALQNLIAAEENMKQGKLGYLPSVNGNTTWLYRKVKNTPDYNEHEFSANISWEADIWGKIRSTKRASVAKYLQTVAAQQAIQTEIVANIASTYYQLLALDAQVKVAEKTLINRNQSIETIKALKTAGIVNEVSVKQTEAQKYATEIILKDLKYNVIVFENTLSILIGKSPKALKRTSFENQKITANIKTGIPALLLSRRPDVISAELNFRNSFELTNVARSNFYPSLSVNASGGFNSLELKNWFNSSSLFSSILTGLTQPIFNQRKIKTNFEIAKANQQKAYLQFEKTLLVAGKEVSDALADYKNETEKLVIRRHKLDALKIAAADSDELLKYGMVNYLEVLTAKDNALNTELELINNKYKQLNAVINLYKALGGGY